MSSTSSSPPSNFPLPLPRVRFHLTGFGKFAGVAINPTATIINELRKNNIDFTNNRLDGEPEIEVEIASLDILEVSGVASLRELHSISASFPRDSSSISIFLHLGVAAQGEKFRLESRGLNTANFRTADERGWAPKGQEIIPNSVPFIATAFPLSIWEEKFQSMGFKELYVSDSPGEFLCNWIYFHSLDRCYRSVSLNGIPEFSFFLHIPPFNKIEKSIQLKFLYVLMKEMALYVVSIDGINQVKLLSHEYGNILNEKKFNQIEEEKKLYSMEDEIYEK